MSFERNRAKEEIAETFLICNFCTRFVGISLIDVPRSVRDRLRTYLALVMTTLILGFMVGGEYVYISGQVVKAQSVIDFVGSNLHIAGYGFMSFSKFITIWSERYTFRRLVVELADIWPVSINDDEGVEIKRDSLTALKYRQRLYTFLNGVGVLFYNLTPICILIYLKAQGAPSQLGYVYQLSYPFDKTKPIYHEFAYLFESCSGVLAVFCMLGSDLLFMTMASHISMLLYLLQVKIRHLIPDGFDRKDSFKYYQDIVEVVKTHQRLIRYILDLENAFSVVNLINVLLSSVNICCVMFNIVEPWSQKTVSVNVISIQNECSVKPKKPFIDSWMEMSNKFYLGSVLTQMGIVCWYADDIFRASVGVSDAAYECNWYLCDVRCQRALLLLLHRAQKPLYFTTMKFSAITMTTYSSILTTAYSYFTLLYTSYNQN